MFSWSQVSPKERMGLSVAFIIAGLALFDRLIIAPISNAYRQINREVKIGAMQLYRDLSNIEQRETITADYRSYIQYVRSEGSDEEVTAAILAEVEEIARRSNVNLIGIKPQNTRQEELYKDFAVEVEAEGDMRPLVAFLHGLGSSKQLLRASKLHLSLKDKDSPVLRASVIVTKITIP